MLEDLLCFFQTPAPHKQYRGTVLSYFLDPRNVPAGKLFDKHFLGMDNTSQKSNNQEQESHIVFKFKLYIWNFAISYLPTSNQTYRNFIQKSKEIYKRTRIIKDLLRPSCSFGLGCKPNKGGKLNRETYSMRILFRTEYSQSIGQSMNDWYTQKIYILKRSFMPKWPIFCEASSRQTLPVLPIPPLCHSLSSSAGISHRLPSTAQDAHAQQLCPSAIPQYPRTSLDEFVSCLKAGGSAQSHRWGSQG